MKRVIISVLFLTSSLTVAWAGKIPIKKSENECYIVVLINPTVTKGFITSFEFTKQELDKVNQKIKEGYEPIGGLSYKYSETVPGKVESAAQAMIFPKCFKSRK